MSIKEEKMMTQEDKRILLKDLCERLPHYTIVLMGDGGIEPLISVNVDTGICNGLKGLPKPYLRPMSSMTEEEREVVCSMNMISDTELNDRLNYQRMYVQNYTIETFDYFNERKLDYRGLIEKGLALEAPPEMYGKEESEEGSEVPIPKTVDEAVKTLAKIVSKEDRDYLLENGAISMHDSMGRWIRNEWGLWTGSELKDELMNMNKGFNHPDDMSNYIIEEFIKYLTSV